jgi:RNA polymerase sigma-70 factor (ECF subfamily)
MNDDRAAIETLIRAAWEAQDHEHAAALTIEHYGPELLAYLISLTHDPSAASEVFGQFSEDFWRSWPRFEWRCSVRTWAYKLVRRAASHHRKRERRHERAQPLTLVSQLSIAVERVRTATAVYKRTDIKDRFQALREQLPEDDQTLLILRVDRDLSWLELAEIMLGHDGIADAEQLKTEAARLRKRFQLAKDRLRELVEAAGLLDDDER